MSTYSKSKKIAQASVKVPVSEVKTTKVQTIEMASKLPDNWVYTPVDGNKRPQTKDWLNKPFTKSQVIKALTNNSRWKGVGCLCGKPSGGLLFLDRDGASCDELIVKLSGLPLIEALPYTAIVSSGRPGRQQHIYQVSEEYWNSIKTTRCKTGIKSDDGKPEQLEFRWDGCQSVVCGEHPLTGSYRWVTSLETTQIADAPMWMIEQMIAEREVAKPYISSQPSSYTVQKTDSINNADSEVSIGSIRTALNHIGQEYYDSYDLWIKVGQALHSYKALDLLPVWDEWSSQSESYSEGSCAKKWKTFKDSNGGGNSVNIFWLFKTAKEIGAYDLPENWQEWEENSNSVIEVECFTNDDEWDETRKAVEMRRSINQQEGVLKSVLAGTELGSIVSKLSEGSSIPFEALLSLIIPLYAPLLGNKAKVRVNTKTAWSEPFVFYMAFLAEANQSKTPISSPLSNPLLDFESRLKQDYETELAVYDSELENYKLDKKSNVDDLGLPPKKPDQRKYLLSSFTFEAFQNQVVKQPGKGLSVHVDELAGLFKTLNQYRAGDDIQNLLSWWSGKGINRTTMANGSQFCRSTGNSISGTIQPGVLRELRSTIDPDDSMGFWYRWLTYTLPTTWEYNLDEDDCTFDLQAECDLIFGNIISTWDAWSEFEIQCPKGTGKWIDDRIKFSDISPEYKGKLKAYAIRFAGFIACVENTRDRADSPSTLDQRYLQMGLDMAKYYHRQNIVAFDSAGEGDETLKRIHTFVTKKGKATVSILKNRDRLLQKISSQKLTDLCSKCAIAYPDLVWDGKTLKVK